MQLSCGSSAAAKPSSQPRSSSSSEAPFRNGSSPDVCPRPRGARYKGVLRLAGSLRLCDRRVQSTSCRTSFAETANAEEPSSHSARTAYPHGSELPDRSRRSPAGDRASDCTSGSVPCPRASTRAREPTELSASRARRSPPERDPRRRDEDDRCAVAGVCPLGEERLAVGRQREAVPLRRGLDRRQRESHDLPARWRPPLDGRLRRIGDVPADPKAGNGRRSARPTRLLGGRRGLFGRAATGDDERERDAGQPANEPSIGHARDTDVTVTGACSARCSTTASTSARLRTGRRARPHAGARPPS